jgi:hypothetical protein
MPIRTLQFNTSIHDRIQEANTVSCIERHDCVLDAIDGRLIASRRPGLTAFASLGTGASVNGIFFWKRKGFSLAVSDQKVFKITQSGIVTQIGTIAGTRRVTFAEFRTPTNVVLMAAGARIYSTDGATVTVLADEDAPTAVSFVRSFDQYALANEIGTDLLHFSDALTFDPGDWAGDVISVEGKPDDLVAVVTGFDEIGLFGPQSVERYYNDGVTPFVVIPGGSVEYGTIAPYSVKLIDNSYFYLSNERRLVRLSGSQPQVISQPVDSLFHGIDVVSDAIADHIIENGRGLYVLTFPTANRTIVYDYINNLWLGDWSTWNTSTASYDRWQGNYVEFVDDWNKTLVGGLNGEILVLDKKSNQDNTGIMRTSFISGNLGGNDHEWIFPSELRLLLKRGYGKQGEDAPEINIRYRDNGSLTWSNIKTESMGKVGEYEFEVKFRRLGRYKSRQYEIFVTDDAPFVIGSALETADGTKTS